jgi:hypothetical protein
MRVFRGIYFFVKWIIVRVLILASGMDVLLKASRWFGWESVPRWPVVRFYNPERYAPYVGLTGGWSPFGSWHNSFVLGGFGGFMLVFAMLMQWVASRELQKDAGWLEHGWVLPETLVRIRPVSRPYFVWLFLASVGSVVALCSPEIFASQEVVPRAVQLILGACLGTVAVDEYSFLLTEDVKRIAEEASGV